MEGIRIYRFDEADETRRFELGRFDLVVAEGMTLGRAEYEPGWRRSEHVGPALGERYVSIHVLGADAYATAQS